MGDNPYMHSRIRGMILELLAVECSAMDTKVLQRLLDDLGYSMTHDDLMTYLKYLSHATRGYVDMEVRSARGREAHMATITPDGLLLVDGLHPRGADPGVHLAD